MNSRCRESFNLSNELSKTLDTNQRNNQPSKPAHLANMKETPRYPHHYPQTSYHLGILKLAILTHQALLHANYTIAPLAAAAASNRTYIRLRNSPYTLAHMSRLTRDASRLRVYIVYTYTYITCTSAQLSSSRRKLSRGKSSGRDFIYARRNLANHGPLERAKVYVRTNVSMYV